MTRALLRKEVRQHWVAVVLLSAGTMFGYTLIILATLTRREAGSGFEVLRLFLMLMGPLAAVLLCHRLVVLEYQARTQLFLEGLPIARWRMVTVKYVAGLSVMLSLCALAFIIACGLSFRREAPSARFVAILALRSISVSWFVYSFCFLLGLLGRYRVPLYLAVFLAVALLFEHAQIQVAHTGPVALLDTRFAYESEVFPWNALRVTWLIGLLFMGLTAVLSLIREGSVAALLAEKMSHKEKIFIAALLFGLLEAASLLSDKTRKVPFDLHDAVTERQPGVVVKVASGVGEERLAAQRLARSVVAELSSARQYLGIEELPPVFITHRRDLDANRYERGELEGNEGVQVRANFAAPDWDLRRFQIWLLREVLDVNSHSRAELESRRWVLDGFPMFWALRAHQQAGVLGDKTAALRALYGVDSGISVQDFNRWLSFRERVGQDITEAVAWSALRTLVRHQGEPACQRFLRSVLAAHPPKDARASIGSEACGADRLLQIHSGIELQPFFNQWQTDLAEARRSLASELAQLPKLKGDLSFVRLSQDSRKIGYRLVISPPPTAETPYSFLHRSLSAFDEEVQPESLQREQNRYPRQAQDELPETFSRGGRLYWTFAMELPELGCQIISGWKRQEIQ